MLYPCYSPLPLLLRGWGRRSVVWELLTYSRPALLLSYKYWVGVQIVEGALFNLWTHFKVYSDRGLTYYAYEFLRNSTTALTV